MMADMSHSPHNNNQGRIIRFLVIFSVLALASVALRILSKWMQLSKIFWDDVLLVVAIVQMLAVNILFAIAMSRGGFGLHMADVSAAQLVFFNKSYFVAGLVMPSCYATAKLSMLWFLNDIFSYPKFQRVVRILAVVVGCWWIATMFLNTFICFPIQARWNPTVGGNCSHKVIQVEFFATPIPWIITDFAILIAPLPVLWRMKISRARQVALLLLFSIGILTCGVACKRYVTLLDIDDTDLTFSMVEPCIWTIIESSTTIICSALPGSARALRKFLPTTYLSHLVERIEVRYNRWKRNTTQRWLSGRRDVQLARDVPDSPPANLSTRKLDITPI